ncbi:DUF480 domain-containing protein [Nakamurella lactea]|uniref:DUF480 domain-containing protein n=1 Tax=Nakamurella lactea TaxID=459515 RepID=UPI0004147E20|nr:DUF480 domain-containing protein [Nakamurella lactea]
MAETDDPRPQLTPVEQRVLGALLEKERTVPASYPMTQNGLRSACNQTSSRDPVTDYDDQTLHEVLGGLRDRELVRTVWTGAGSRAVKFHQRLAERLQLDDAIAEPALAILTVLLLRGPQAPGELRTRTERLHTFPDRTAVEAMLQQLAALTEPLVLELERRPGQQDRRWAHVLGELPAESSGAVPVVDRESLLADGAEARDAMVVAGYDACAEGYAEQLRDELAGKPFDRWLLDLVAAAATGGPVADVGCGPGQVTAYLAAAGAVATGFDLSPGMIERARAEHPDVEFEVGDLTRLLRPRAAAGWTAITAWYSLVHLADSELPGAVAGLARVLIPGGVLALALHIGDGIHHADELFGATVDLDFVLHDRQHVLTAIEAAGLVDVEWYLRGPNAAVEVATERLYVLARRSE